MCISRRSARPTVRADASTVAAAQLEVAADRIGECEGANGSGEIPPAPGLFVPNGSSVCGPMPLSASVQVMRSVSAVVARIVPHGGDCVVPPTFPGSSPLLVAWPKRQASSLRISFVDSMLATRELTPYVVTAQPNDAHTL